MLQVQPVENTGTVGGLLIGSIEVKNDFCFFCNPVEGLKIDNKIIGILKVRGLSIELLVLKAGLEQQRKLLRGIPAYTSIVIVLIVIFFGGGRSDNL